MAYENPLMVELMVPRDPEVAERALGFYGHIGWRTYNTDSEFFTYVHPRNAGDVPPTIAYWQTENETKIAQFTDNPEADPSIYARGLRLPNLQELVEVCLVVPTDDDVHTIFDRGRSLLEKHTHVKPRDHAGVQEFRFTDPFNYSLRVTADPGWEIKRAVPAEISGITKHDFAADRGSARSVGTSWGNLLKFIKQEPDFPLQFGDTYEELRGDLNAAINWLTEHRPGAMNASFVTRLLRLKIARDEKS